MASKMYGMYFQGAMIKIEDFDPAKVVLCMCKTYEVEISDELRKAIMTDKLSDEQYAYLYEKLDVKCEEYSLEKMRDDLLDEWEINDICCDDSEIPLASNHISAILLREIDGEFVYDNEDKPSESVSDCIMMGFYVPFLWRMKEFEIPVDKRLAVSWLQDAGKSFLKDDINWEERLGELYAIGFTN